MTTDRVPPKKLLSYVLTETDDKNGEMAMVRIVEDLLSVLAFLILTGVLAGLIMHGSFSISTILTMFGVDG